MRRWFVLACLAASCATNPPPQPVYYAPAGSEAQGGPPPEFQAASIDLTRDGKLDDRLVDFQFEGGELDFELYRLNGRIYQTVRNRYVVPVMVSWSVSSLENLRPVTAVSGATYVPAASAPLASGPVVVLAELEQVDLNQRYRRELSFRARF